MNTTQTTLQGTKVGNRFLQHGEFVPVAALTASRVTDSQLENTENLYRLYNLQKTLAMALGNALPLETEMKSKLGERLHMVKNEIARFEHTPEFDLPTIDPSFLGWKTRSGFPGFSIFTLENDTTTIRFDHNLNDSFLSDIFSGVSGAVPLSRFIEARSRATTLEMKPVIPDFMAREYLDDKLRFSLEALCDERRVDGITVTAHYGGVMPDDVRQKIHTCLKPSDGKRCFENIFIVAEAPEEAWKVAEIPRKDPLVLGVAHGLLWLIAAYDLTPVEKFASELCRNASQRALN